MGKRIGNQVASIRGLRKTRWKIYMGETKGEEGNSIFPNRGHSNLPKKMGIAYKFLSEGVNHTFLLSGSKKKLRGRKKGVWGVELLKETRTRKKQHKETKVAQINFLQEKEVGGKTL